MKSVAELLRLDERVAVITGGAGYIGLAVAEALAEQGASIVVVDREPAPTRERAELIAQRFGVGTLPVALDLGAAQSGTQIVDETLRRFGRLDIVVNNAAFTGMSGLSGYAVPFAEQTLEAWDAALRVNLTAAFQLCHAAREPLALSGQGAILNVSSIYGNVGPNMTLYEGTAMGNPAAYAATKGGLIQLSRYLATLLAPSVRVNAISPGGIERGQPEAFQQRYQRLTPLRRMGREEDLKAIALLLVSDAGAYITGQNVLVDGGWTAW
jgi:NAD(P)-dependent dehydrogenase (short-subunit alcohol dehydrogenase family)